MWERNTASKRAALAAQRLWLMSPSLVSQVPTESWQRGGHDRGAPVAAGRDRAAH